MGTPLNYSKPEHPRRRLVIRLIAGLLIIAGVAAGIDRLRTTWPGIRIWWAYRQCANFRFADEDVAFAMVNGAGPKVATFLVEFVKGAGTGIVPRREVNAKVSTAAPWSQLRPHVINAALRPDPGDVFLHERRGADGKNYLVHVSLDVSAEIMLRAITISPATFTKPPEFVEQYAPLHVSSEYIGRLKLMAGQPDPSDPSRFTIRYTLDGAPGVIEGKLGDSNVVNFTPTHGWAFRGTHYDLWEPEGYSPRMAEVIQPVRRVAAPADDALGGVPASPRAIAYTPDGKSLVIVHQDGWRLLDVASGKATAAIEVELDDLSSVAVSPDGQTLAAAGDQALWLYHLARPTAGRRIELPHPAADLTFTPDNQRILLADESGLRAYDVRTGQPVIDIKRRSPAGSVAVSPDGRTLVLAGGDDKQAGWVAVVDAGSGRILVERRTEDTELTVRFNPEGQLILAAGFDRTWTVPDATTLKPLVARDAQYASSEGLFRGETSGQVAQFSPVSPIVAVMGNSGPVNLWQYPAADTMWSLDEPVPAEPARPANKTTGLFGSPGTRPYVPALQSFAFSPDGKTVAAVDEKGSLVFWDVEAALKQKGLTAGERPR